MSEARAEEGSFRRRAEEGSVRHRGGQEEGKEGRGRAVSDIKIAISA